MNVPLLDLQAQYAPLRDEILAAITRVCDSQRFIMGPGDRRPRARAGAPARRPARDRRVVGHRRAAARADGARHQGRRRGRHDDLFVLRDGRRDRPRRRAARARRHRSGDVQHRSGAVAAAITPRTKAILPVHLFGLSADLDPIVEAAARAPACRSSKTRRRRSARPTSRGRSAASARSAASRSFPARTSAPSATRAC